MYRQNACTHSMVESCLSLHIKQGKLAKNYISLTEVVGMVVVKVCLAFCIKKNTKCSAL
jgi:hypothetical protein